MSSQMEYDLLIVGAGTAGCIAAKTAAERGLSVCLMERKPREKIGEKVCADGITKQHFDNLGLDYPSGDEVARNVKGIKVYSPDKKTIYELKGGGLEGFILNRKQFGQRLLREALSEGVTLLDSHSALEAVIEGKFVNGVIAENLRNGTKLRVNAKIVIDASGSSAVLRRKLSSKWGFEDPSPEDMVVCYREIRSLLAEVEDPDYCHVYINQIVSPGGYYWIFPRGLREVNVGLGIQMKAEHPSPGNSLYKHILTFPLFKGSKALSKGAGIIPTRRALNRLVANGFMVVGDAACTANPVHGGGIGPSMLSGKLAAEVATKAIESGDRSEEALWQYAVNYMRSYGAKQASLDIFRLFIQSLTNEEHNYGMRHRLLTPDDLLKVSMYGKAEISLVEKIWRLIKGMGKPSLLNKLRKAVSMMDELRELYSDFPDLKGFAEWKRHVDKIYLKAKRTFRPLT